MSESSFAPPTPRRLDLPVRIADTDEPNAFTVGRKASNALVVVTSGVCVRLTDEELDAVLAHEPRDHPRLEKRLALLSEIARELGHVAD